MSYMSGVKERMTKEIYLVITVESIKNERGHPHENQKIIDIMILYPGSLTLLSTVSWT